MQYAFSSCQSTPYSLLMNQEILPVYYTVATPLPPPQKIFSPTPFSIPLSYFSSKCFKSFLSDERSAPKHACLENTQVSARTENVGSTVGWVNMYKICEQKCTKTWKIEFLTRPDMKIALSNSFQKGVLNLCRKYLHKIIFPQNWGFF